MWFLAASGISIGVLYDEDMNADNRMPIFDLG